MIQRYNKACGIKDGNCHEIEQEDGPYVKYEDYQSLERWHDLLVVLMKAVQKQRNDGKMRLSSDVLNALAELE